MIRTVTQSYWNHASMYIGNEEFIESDFDGVVVRKLDDLKDRKIRIYRHKQATDKHLDYICDRALEYEGAKYDWKALVELGWMFTSGKRGDDVIGSGNRFICSEIVALPYQEQGYMVRDDRDYDEVVPGDFDISENFRRLEI